MNVRSLSVGPFEANCHLLWDEAGTALVVDPGAEPDRIAKEITRRNLTVTAFLLTHGHIDHLSALPDLLARFPAPVGLHPRDAAWAFKPVNALPPYYEALEQAVPVERAFAEGQTWTDGALSYRILETPGHSPGGVCLLFEQARVLVSGDTLFAGSVGRTDLPGGNASVLTASLRRLAALEGDYRVLAGHGPETRLAGERRHNPFLAPLARTGRG